MSLEKAKLTFLRVNDREQPVNVIEPEKRYGSSQGITGKIKSLSTENLTNLKNKMNDTLNNYANHSFTDNLKSFMGISAAAGGQDSNTLYLQFNPSSISMTAYGGGEFINMKINQNEDGDNKADQNISFSGVNAYIGIRLRMIFDAENNMDAFMVDKLNAVNSPLKTVYFAAGKAVGREYTVRPIVEGFIAAIRKNSEYRVIFTWGKLRYSGTINSVQGVYTMFNVSGEPIRAEVSIELFSADNKALEEWKAKYNQNIIEYAKSETSNVSNSLNNLLNLQL